MTVQAATRGAGIPKWFDVPPVFIVGAPRTGTTLMRLMLTADQTAAIEERLDTSIVCLGSLSLAECVGRRRRQGECES